MPRSVHPTPRHLDDPPRLGPLTFAGWGWALLALVVVWFVASQLDFLPILWRVVAGAVVVGLCIGITDTGGGRSLSDLPRRAWHSLTTPAEHLPGEARTGPLRLELYDDTPRDQESDSD